MEPDCEAKPHELDIEWKTGKLIRSMIRNVSAGGTGECKICYGGVTKKIIVPKGEAREFTGADK